MLFHFEYFRENVRYLRLKSEASTKVQYGPNFQVPTNLFFFKKWTLVTKKWREVLTRKLSPSWITAWKFTGGLLVEHPVCVIPQIYQNFFKAKYWVSHKTIWISSKNLWLKHIVDSRPHTVPEEKWLINAQRNLFLAFQLLL